MYQDVSSFGQLLNFSWDLFVIAVMLVAIFYVFGNMIISTGIPQYYVERYIYTLFSSIVGFQFLFTMLFYLGHKETIKIFGFPIIALSNLSTNQLLEKMFTYVSSSTFLLFFFFLSTIPFLSLFEHLFRNEVELRQNKVLIKPYIITLIIVILCTIVMFFVPSFLNSANLVFDLKSTINSLILCLVGK